MREGQNVEDRVIAPRTVPGGRPKRSGRRNAARPSVARRQQKRLPRLPARKTRGLFRQVGERFVQRLEPERQARGVEQIARRRRRRDCWRSPPKEMMGTPLRLSARAASKRKWGSSSGSTAPTGCRGGAFAGGMTGWNGRRLRSGFGLRHAGAAASRQGLGPARRPAAARRIRPAAPAAARHCAAGASAVAPPPRHRHQPRQNAQQRQPPVLDVAVVVHASRLLWGGVCGRGVGGGQLFVGVLQRVTLRGWKFCGIFVRGGGLLRLMCHRATDPRRVVTIYWGIGSEADLPLGPLRNCEFSVSELSRKSPPPSARMRAGPRRRSGRNGCRRFR